MKITKAHSQENRARVVERASALFREHGFDGVSVADLMDAAGLTHGGFYKHFGSKADLMAEAATYGLEAKMRDYQGVNLHDFVNGYLSDEHRDNRGEGCTMAALSGDAARQSPEVQAAFAAGIAKMLAVVERGATVAGSDQAQARAQAISLYAQLVGALVLSRACPDGSPLADEILAVCRAKSLASLLPRAPSKKLASRRRSAG